MSSSASLHGDDAVRAALSQRIAETMAPLHGIRSRSEPDQIAVEVFRLNAAGRAGAQGLFDAYSQPADFQRVLLDGADSSNGEFAQEQP